MAITDYRAEVLISSVPFLQRVALNLGSLCQDIENEAVSVPLHAQRVSLAARILFSIGVSGPTGSQYVIAFAGQVVTQLDLATDNLVAVNGIPNADTADTDARLRTLIARIYNDFIT